MTEPTDAELTECYKAANGEDVGKAQPITTQRIFRAMRAAIAKWGTPPVVAGEPNLLRAAAIELRDAPDLRAMQRATAKLYAAIDTTPQPTQAQAGAVPLTDREQSLISALRYECDHSARNDMRMMECYGHPWSKVVGVPETTIDAVIEGWHKAHGIKGGQYGADT